MVWNDPRDWTAGETVSALLLNTHLRDNFKALGDPWTPFSVQEWSSSGTSPAIGNGTLVTVYARAGKLFIYRIVTTMGSTTTYGTGTWQWGLPYYPASGNWTPIGNATIYDSSTGGVYGRTAVFASTGRVRLVDASNGWVGPTTPITFATGDVVAIQGMFETT